MAAPKLAITSRVAISRTRSRIKTLDVAGADRQTLSELGEAHLELAEHLARLDRFTEAAEEFDAAHLTLSKAGDAAQAARVRVRLAGVLMVLGRREEALSAVDAVINAGGRVEEASEVMPMAYLWRVVALHELGQDEEALTKARRLVRRFGPGSTAFQRQIVAKALLLEGELALACDDRAGALRAAHKILRTYGQEAGPGAPSLRDSVDEARRRVATLADEGDSGSRGSDDGG